MVKVKNDHRSTFSNLCNWKEEAWKIKASTGFEPVTSAIPVRCSTNWAVKPHIGNEANSLSSYLPWGVKWYEIYMTWSVFLKLINYSCSSYPTRASYSGQVDEFRNPMKTELKTRPCLKAVFQIIWNTDANFLNLHIDKATKTRGDKQLFNHTFYETNFKPKLFTANVECNGTVIKLPKTEKPILFLNFKFSLNGGDLVFWFTFNLAVDFQPKMV